MSARTATRRSHSPAVTGWLMALPAMLLIAMFLVAPFIFAFIFSFTDQRLVSPNPTAFVGLRNFENLLGVGVLPLEPTPDAKTGDPTYPEIRAFTRNNAAYPHLNGMREMFTLPLGRTHYAVLASDPLFMRALLNTLLFVIMVAPLQGGLALCLALLINQKLRGINIYRTIYFMPVVVSIVVVSLLWRFIYSGQDGLLNSLLGAVSFGFFPPVDWLGNTATALGAIIAMSIWQAVGFHMVIWLSGLQTIPVSLYEAAGLEGASSWQQFWFITWPGLRNTAVLVLIVITMQAFALFSQINVMTRGGPLDSTQTLVFQAVLRGYEKQDIAGGSAVSVMLFLLVLTVSLIQRYFTRETAA